MPHHWLTEFIRTMPEETVRDGLRTHRACKVVLSRTALEIAVNGISGAFSDFSGLPRSKERKGRTQYR